MWFWLRHISIGYITLALALLPSNGYATNYSILSASVSSTEEEIVSDSLEILKLYNLQIDSVVRTSIPSNQDSFLLFIATTLKLAESLNNKKELAHANYNLGKFHIAAHSEYSLAIPALLKALSVYEGLQDSLGIAKCYMQLGLISYITQYFEDAIKNFKISLKYIDYTTTTYLMAITYTETEDYKKAKEHFLSAIKAYQQDNNQKGLSECYMYLGKLYIAQSQNDSAYHYLKMAIKNQQKHFDTNFVSRPYAMLSEYFLSTNQFDSALFYAEKSLSAIKNGGDQISTIISIGTLSKVYEQQGDFEKAHHYLKKYFDLRDENMQGNTKQKIAEMQSVFEFKRKMAEEELKHQEAIHRENRFKYILLISGAFILMITGGLWSRLQYVRKSKAALQEAKNISEGLLLNILPYEVAEELKLKGEAQPRKFERVSILFTDFVQFTEHSTRLTAVELVNEVNHCFEAFDRIMEVYGIEKIKTIGDAYMAAGGLPIPTDDSVERTIRAALHIQSFIADRARHQHEKALPYFEMRVGIHTGPIVAGIVGLKKFQYDVWGDTVNTANRMESHGVVGKVNISNDTYKLVNSNPAFTFESRGKVNVKGKGEMEMWFVSNTVKL